MVAYFGTMDGYISEGRDGVCCNIVSVGPQVVFFFEGGGGAGSGPLFGVVLGSITATTTIQGTWTLKKRAHKYPVKGLPFHKLSLHVGWRFPGFYLKRFLRNPQTKWAERP